MAGSYVPKTTAQLKVLTETRGATGQLAIIEIKVEQLIASPETASQTIAQIVKETENHLKAGQDTLVMTSRKLITGDDELSSLKIGSAVAEALVSVLQKIEVRPRYIIAKVLFFDQFALKQSANVSLRVESPPQMLPPRASMPSVH